MLLRGSFKPFVTAETDLEETYKAHNEKIIPKIIKRRFGDWSILLNPSAILLEVPATK